jgi:hypothetical protein
MPVSLPVVTRREVARELRLAGGASDASALRALKNKGALSAGIDVPRRGSGGKVEGRLHIYSALNRDAARAVRHNYLTLATELCKAANRLERSPELRRIAVALGDVGGLDSTAELAQALSGPAMLTDVLALEAKQAKARRRFSKYVNITMITGRVSELNDQMGVMRVPHHHDVVLPRVTIDEAGVGQVGSPCVAQWELLPGGRTLVSVEPAVDAPEVTGDGDPLVDVYGTPWGAILADTDVLDVVGAPTIKIHDDIPDVA